MKRRRLASSALLRFNQAAVAMLKERITIKKRAVALEMDTMLSFCCRWVFVEARPFNFEFCARQPRFLFCAGQVCMAPQRNVAVSSNVKRQFS